MPRGTRKYIVDLQQIREALVQSGYTKLDQQAKALGVHRSTAWTLVKTRHKLGRLSAKTTQRILANLSNSMDLDSPSTSSASWSLRSGKPPLKSLH